MTPRSSDLGPGLQLVIPLLSLATSSSLPIGVPAVGEGRLPSDKFSRRCVHGTSSSRLALNKLGTHAMAAVAAAMVSTSGVGFDLAQPVPAPAYAFPYLTKTSTATARELAELYRNALYKLAFDKSEKLDFSEVGWTNAEVQVLSKALTPSSATESRTPPHE